MRKTTKTLLILVIFIGIVMGSPKAINASSDIKVLLDNQELKFDVPPQIVEGRTLLPLRVIFENLGLEVGWDNKTKIITGTNDNTKIVLKLDSADATVNGVKYKLDVPAKAINGRTLVPVRFVAESLGIMVDWVQDTRTVIINRDDEIITFKDTNFEKEIRRNIEKPSGNIYKSDVERTTFLSVGGDKASKISNLEGLQYFKNLKDLYINENNNISDLSPLKKLYDLKSISITSDELESLEPLSKLLKLEELIIRSSNIENVDFLGDLINLKSLALYLDNLVDISSLKKLENLEEIVLNDTNISNIDVLKNLKNLKQVFIINTKVQDISPLMELPKLEYINARNIPVKIEDFAKVYQPLIKKGVQIITSYNEDELLRIKIEKEFKFDDIDDIFHLDELLKILPINNYAKMFVDNGHYFREDEILRLGETEYYDDGSISYSFNDKNQLVAHFSIEKQNDKNFNYLKDKIKEKYGRPFTEDVKEDSYGDAKITRWAGGIELRRYPGYRQGENKRTQLWVIKKRSTGDNKYDNEFSVQEIKAYLASNFGTLDTNIGTTKFTFNIHENKSIYSAYDYWIQVKYEYEFFSGAVNSIDYSNEQKNKLRQELKEHQKNIGEALIELLPNKKLYGGYYDSWYRYPNLRVDLITRRYYSWTNYDEPEWGLDISDYEQTTPSNFRWYDLIDDKL